MAAADGILCIQRGETPRVMRALLYAYLGEEGVHEDTSRGPRGNRLPPREPCNRPGRGNGARAVAETADDARCRQELADIMAVNGRVSRKSPYRGRKYSHCAAGRLSADGARILAGCWNRCPYRSSIGCSPGSRRMTPSSTRRY